MGQVSTVITFAGGSVNPEVVDGYEARRPARTLVHPIMGRDDPDITYRPVGLRKGTLTLVFGTGALAAAAEDALIVPRVYTLTDPDVAEVGMQFVVADGEIVRTLDLETQTVWLLEVPFQEVSP